MTQKQHCLYPQLPVTAIHLQKQVGQLRLRKYLTHLFDTVMDILQKYEPLLYLEKMKPQPVNHSWLLLYILQSTGIPGSRI